MVSGSGMVSGETNDGERQELAMQDYDSPFVAYFRMLC